MSLASVGPFGASLGSAGNIINFIFKMQLIVNGLVGQNLKIAVNHVTEDLKPFEEDIK